LICIKELLERDDCHELNHDTGKLHS
jgi:hypothetical protein